MILYDFVGFYAVKLAKYLQKLATDLQIKKSNDDYSTVLGLSIFERGWNCASENLDYKKRLCCVYQYRHFYSSFHLGQEIPDGDRERV